MACSQAVTDKTKLPCQRCEQVITNGCEKFSIRTQVQQDPIDTSSSFQDSTIAFLVSAVRFGTVSPRQKATIILSICDAS